MHSRTHARELIRICFESRKIGFLKAAITHWMLASSEGVRGLSSLELANQLATNGVASNCVIEHDTPLHAFTQAVTMASEQDRIVVFGSFVTVGAVLALIES